MNWEFTGEPATNLLPLAEASELLILNSTPHAPQENWHRVQNCEISLYKGNYICPYLGPICIHLKDLDILLKAIKIPRPVSEWLREMATFKGGV